MLPVLVFVNKVLQEQSHQFIQALAMAAVAQQWQSLYSLQSLKYSLSGLLQKKFANP